MRTNIPTFRQKRPPGETIASRRRRRRESDLPHDCFGNPISTRPRDRSRPLQNTPTLIQLGVILSIALHARSLPRVAREYLVTALVRLYWNTLFGAWLVAPGTDCGSRIGGFAADVGDCSVHLRFAVISPVIRLLRKCSSSILRPFDERTLQRDACGIWPLCVLFVDSILHVTIVIICAILYDI